MDGASPLASSAATTAASVPAREGQYGDRVAAVEPGGVEFIHPEERHGRPRSLFFTWTSPNLEFATVFVGILPIAIFGGGFWWTAIGVVVGSALGSLTHGFLSAQGPRFGVPQMVQSRGAFGYRGNVLPAGLNALTASVGWFIVNSVSGAFALSSLAHVRFAVSYTIVVLAQVAVAFVGHNFIHLFERLVFPYLALVFAAACAVVLWRSHPGAGAQAAVGGQWGAFILAVFIAFGYAAGWNPYASDYTRYLPQGSSRRAVGLAAGLGVFISCAVLEVAGAAAATIGKLGANPVDLFTGPLPSWLAKLVLVGIALGAVSANVLNIYSGAMSFLTLGLEWSFRQRRALVALLSGGLGLFIGLVFQANVGPGSKYENFLLAIAYWIGPWLAVFLVDYLLRRGRYSEQELFDKSRRGLKGALAMALGIGASYPFWDQAPPVPMGWVPKYYPQAGDLSFFVGFAVSALVYWGLTALEGRARTRAVPAAPAADG